jgi:hypothetical protein
MHSDDPQRAGVLRLPLTGLCNSFRQKRIGTSRSLPLYAYRSDSNYCTTILSGRLCTTYTVVFDCELVKTFAVPVTITV